MLPYIACDKFMVMRGTSADDSAQMNLYNKHLELKSYKPFEQHIWHLQMVTSESLVDNRRKILHWMAQV